jgi:hypothetical protein
MAPRSGSRSRPCIHAIMYRSVGGLCHLALRTQSLLAPSFVHMIASQDPMNSKNFLQWLWDREQESAEYPEGIPGQHGCKEIGSPELWQETDVLYKNIITILVQGHWNRECHARL